MSVNRREFLAALNFPELDGFAMIASQARPVGTESDAPNHILRMLEILRSLEGAEFLAAGNVPQFDCPLMTPRSQILSVGTEGKGIDLRRTSYFMYGS